MPAHVNSRQNAYLVVVYLFVDDDALGLTEFPL